MKTIQSLLLGSVPITARDKHVRLFQVKQVINQHRDLFINKFLKDIPYYLAFRYNAFATPDELEEIKAKLNTLQKKDIDLVDYASIFEQIKKRTTVKLNNAIFFQEIDDLLFAQQKS